MKIARFLVPFVVVATLTICSSLRAAPVESVESASASSAFQKVDAFLSEKVVADQLAALGLSQEQAQAQLARLSEAQIEQFAAQVDLIQAGGTIQRDPNRNPLGPIGCAFKHLGILIYDVFEFLFCWGDLK
jgi:hypothetical protein